MCIVYFSFVLILSLKLFIIDFTRRCFLLKIEYTAVSLKHYLHQSAIVYFC